MNHETDTGVLGASPNGQLHNNKPAASRGGLTEKKLPDCLTSLTHLSTDHGARLAKS